MLSEFKSDYTFNFNKLIHLEISLTCSKPALIWYVFLQVSQKSDSRTTLIVQGFFFFKMSVNTGVKIKVWDSHQTTMQVWSLRGGEWKGHFQKSARQLWSLSGFSSPSGTKWAGRRVPHCRQICLSYVPAKAVIGWESLRKAWPWWEHVPVLQGGSIHSCLEQEDLLHASLWLPHLLL